MMENKDKEYIKGYQFSLKELIVFCVSRSIINSRAFSSEVNESPGPFF